MAVIQIPSSCGHGEYDLFAEVPVDMTLEVAREYINAHIRDVNKEAAQHEEELCADGLCVEDSLKQRLTKRGFVFFELVKTYCYDEDPTE